MNRYDWYPGDYLRDTLDLSMVEDCAYRRLLDAYFSTEKRLDSASVFRIARCQSRSEKLATQRVLDRFFRLETVDGHSAWVNDRAEREIAKARPKIRAARENGKKGGRPPKQKPDGKPSGLASEEPKPNPERKLPSPSPSPSPTSPKGDDPPLPPQGAFRLTKDWDCGWMQLATCTVIPEWAHSLLLDRFKAVHLSRETTRTDTQWRQSYTSWAAREWQERRPKPDSVERDEWGRTPAEVKAQRERKAKEDAWLEKRAELERQRKAEKLGVG